MYLLFFYEIYFKVSFFNSANSNCFRRLDWFDSLKIIDL